MVIFISARDGFDAPHHRFAPSGINLAKEDTMCHDGIHLLLIGFVSQWMKYETIREDHRHASLVAYPRFPAWPSGRREPQDVSCASGYVLIHAPVGEYDPVRDGFCPFARVRSDRLHTNNEDPAYTAPIRYSTRSK